MKLFPVLLLFSFIMAEWTNPQSILDLTHSHPTDVTSTYIDPVSNVNHVIFADDHLGQYWHLAVSDDGKVLYKTLFKDTAAGIEGVIRGAGDGKTLFLALWVSEKEVDKVAFTESSDGGMTWAPFYYFSSLTYDRRLQDMLYIEETGRIIIFFDRTPGNDIMMTTRPKGSSLFTTEVRIASNVADRWNDARGLYTANPPTLHVFYKNSKEKLSYVRSSDMGVTWTNAQQISGDSVNSVTSAIAITKPFPKIFVTYVGPNGPGRMVTSSDNGNFFSSAISLTKEYANSNSQGVAKCAAEDKVQLFTLFEVINSAEYRSWDPVTMSFVEKWNPFAGLKIWTALIACSAKTTQFKISAFTVQRKDGQTHVYFAQDRITP